MRKYFAVALALLLLVSAVGVLTLAVDLEGSEDFDTDEVVKIVDNPEDYGYKNADKLIIVTPEAFDGEDYVVHATESGKVVVAVDPIHVTE